MRRSRFMYVLAAIVLISATALMAEEEKKFEADKGPDSVPEATVKSWPADVQEGYAMAKEMCSQCHTFARVLNTKFNSLEDWHGYVKKMSLKPKAKLRPRHVEKIEKFLDLYKK